MACFLWLLWQLVHPLLTIVPVNPNSTAVAKSGSLEEEDIHIMLLVCHSVTDFEPICQQSSYVQFIEKTAGVICRA